MKEETTYPKSMVSTETDICLGDVGQKYSLPPLNGSKSIS
jgi:hypothetical protein